MKTETNIVEISPSRETEHKDVFVEFGPRSQPCTGSRITYDTEYIGIDLDDKNLNIGKQEFENKVPETNRKSAGFFCSPAGRTPLPSSIADEVYMSNVLGSNIDPTLFDNVVRESRRILKDGGIVTILEDNTPASKQGVISMFERFGFVLINELRWGHNSEEWDIMARKYISSRGHHGYDFDSNCYFLQFVKESH